MPTYRERRLAKAERLRSWAESREEKADALHERNEPYRGDWAFASQPGHIPERARVNARHRRAREHEAKASGFRRRAAGIEAAAERAIYSDDPDAIERLEERIAELEAERDRIKRYNASCRRGAPDVSILDEQQRRQIASLQRNAWQADKSGRFPAYALRNLSGNISRQRKRLAALRGEDR